ncbi:XRE family transcriptional regulator [Nakamurella silvestris]|nr:XRE family transcriptional regulator [Nakamurella silvestris]
MDLNPILTPVRDIGAFIREQRTAAQISVRQLAAKAGVSNPYLSQVERGLRNPSADILAQIARGLQISVESLLARAGILEHGDDAPAVVLAIRADPVLTERQKASLLDIYAAFRRESEPAGPAAEPSAASPAPGSPTPETMDTGTVPTEGLTAPVPSTPVPSTEPPVAPVTDNRTHI